MTVILRCSSVMFCVFWMSLRISATVQVHDHDCLMNTSCLFVFFFFSMKAFLLTKTGSLTAAATITAAGFSRYSLHCSLLLETQHFIWSLQWCWKHNLLSLDKNRARQRSCLCLLQDKRAFGWGPWETS